ncbi:hypothetical protein U4E84_03530 [Halorubrum sp. AD140]|uniref:hypothetical protein n=1 Tax=Halorubrum sp. AD140 TaxID=3050073 RepID=UPI002ACC95B3|nr:hypothetical protein [Halorubrum sp. AD140]MDZ5810423.1 hypothetical protein [Halorubrum sp. AD140]
MSGVTTVELALRVVVAAVAIVGPTVLYLGLWRFLAWLRDDALVDRLAARGAVEEPRPAAVDVLASATAGIDGRRCPACGAPVVAGATRCRRCRAEIHGKDG